VGEELAERFEKRISGLSAGMTAGEAISRSVVEKAMSGDMAAVKYIFEAAGSEARHGEGIPFEVDYEVAEQGSGGDGV
jgi:hypothetical protein